MSFFRPPKSKPRQFNYIPRYYDPVKEERDRRRRELHGTSTEDDKEEYTPGRYIRTQREARDAAREGRADEGTRKIMRLGVIAVVVVVAAMMLYPRIISFAERANDEKVARQMIADGVVGELDSLSTPTITLHEMVEDIDFTEFESLDAEAINEIEEWNRRNRSITIYDDNVKIEDGKRVK